MSLSLVDSVLYRFSFFKEVETTYFWKLDHSCRRHTYVINIYLYIQTQPLRPVDSSYVFCFEATLVCFQSFPSIFRSIIVVVVGS